MESSLSKKWRKRSVTEFVLAHGTYEMPIWGQVLREVRPDYKPARREAFSNWRIYNLTGYLESLQAEQPER